MSGAERKAYPLRIDPALWAAVERSAAADLRSINAQVECLLREALGARGVKLKSPAPRKRGRPPKTDYMGASTTYLLSERSELAGARRFRGQCLSGAAKGGSKD